MDNVSKTKYESDMERSADLMYCLLAIRKDGYNEEIASECETLADKISFRGESNSNDVREFINKLKEGFFYSKYEYLSDIEKEKAWTELYLILNNKFNVIKFLETGF